MLLWSLVCLTLNDLGGGRPSKLGMLLEEFRSTLASFRRCRSSPCQRHQCAIT